MTTTTNASLLRITATYSPDDNKLRLYASARLDAETYARVKKAGYAWAPRQELFVAPMWTPERADLAVELAGEIGDEDTSLVDRAEERAERFGDYSDKRAEDADAAHANVATIANGIPFGQPILVGHHSERHARKDAQRIENGMRRAVKMWETSQYWVRRAKGALNHAKYKELPAVRARRIKGLEADKRKHARTIANAERFTKLWSVAGLTVEQATRIANYDHVTLPAEAGQTYGDTLWSALDGRKITAEAASERALTLHARTIAWASRWIAHIDNRLAYERAMLGESGGLAADKFPIEIGGRVFRRRGWFVVKGINRSEGRISSVSVVGHFAGTIAIEDITDYRAPEEGDAEKVKAATKLPPIVNYPGVGFVSMTKAEWDRSAKAGNGRMDRRTATSEYGAHRQREKFAGGFKHVNVFISDMKVVERPKLVTAEPVTFAPVVVAPPVKAPAKAAPPSKIDHERISKIEAMKKQLKAGVEVVQADQLFASPNELAERLVEMAGIEAHHTVLEPSAGTGQLVRAIAKTGARCTSVEVNAKLAATLGARCADFLSLSCTDLGTFDRVVMNPPFTGGQDVEHVTHALGMLATAGTLVAVMSAGVRFREDKKTRAFRALLARHGGRMEDLPEGTFKASGTDVRAIVVTIDAAGRGR
jgi:predicted RNA methylase